MLGEGGPVFFLMPENKMTFSTVKVSSSVHKYWRNCKVIDMRIVYFDYIHVCFNLGMMSSVCWVDTGKCQNIGRVDVWLSDGATHCHTEFWSDILFTGRAESSLLLLLCDCTVYALAGAVSLYPVIDKIRTWLITLSSSTHSPARGTQHRAMASTN